MSYDGSLDKVRLQEADPIIYAHISVLARMIMFVGADLLLYVLRGRGES